MLVLGLETTCDETAFALVREGDEILAEALASQGDLHATYNGVVPELACRRHLEVLIPLLHECLRRAGQTLEQIDAVAYAAGPGLVGALLVGASAGHALATALGVPLLPVHHLEAHLYAAMMSAKRFDCRGSLGLILSGGHTLLVAIDELGTYRVLGQTADDALGESFDKVAVMLGLSYPGGAKLEALALEGDPRRFALPKPRIRDRPSDFSFSGLKTAVWQLVEKLGGTAALTPTDRRDVAAAFQMTAIESIANTTEVSLNAMKNAAPSPMTLYVGGGVARNRALRERLAQIASVDVQFASSSLCTDNAAMIAGLGARVARRTALSTKKRWTVRPKWPLSELAKPKPLGDL